MKDDERQTAFYMALAVLALIAGLVIGASAEEPLGTPHFLAWLVSVALGGLALRRYLYPPQR